MKDKYPEIITFVISGYDDFDSGYSSLNMLKDGVLCQIDKKRDIEDYWEDMEDDDYNIEDYMVSIRICDDTGLEQPDYMFIPQGTAVITKAAYDHKDDILVLEMGSNGGWDDYDELISQYKYIKKNRPERTKASYIQCFPFQGDFYISFFSS